jgi:hypothetical protein
VHDDFHLCRQMLVDIDLHEAIGIAHHPKDRMVGVVVMGKGLPPMNCKGWSPGTAERTCRSIRSCRRCLKPTISSGWLGGVALRL